MRILFAEVADASRETETRYPGLGMAYLVGSLRQRFGKDHFEFKIVERGTSTEVIRQISLLKPDLVCISSVTKNFGFAGEAISFAKRKGIPVIVGGIHISMLPRSLPEDADAACMGEGELTILELVELFDKKGAFPQEDLQTIKGVAYRDYAKRVELTPPRPLIQSLDAIARPARDLLKIEKHSYIFSSRGCPYRCVFCASSRFWDKVRLFSADYVVEEIKELFLEYNVKVISFYDDLFITNLRRLEEIGGLLDKEGLIGRIKFTCSCRANLVNDRVARLLKEIGVASVSMGLESSCQRVLKYLKRDAASIDYNEHAVDILKKHGIAVNASFIIGSPEETEQEMMETYNFIKDSKVDLIDINVLMPFPGTPVWDYAAARGLVSEDMDWSRLTSNFDEDHEKAIIVSEIYSRKEIYRFYKKFRRLRIMKNIKNIWHSPFLIDLPKFLWRLAAAKTVSLFGKIKSGFFTNG